MMMRLSQNILISEPVDERYGLVRASAINNQLLTATID